MNNSVFGKTMENIRNRVDVKLVTSKSQLEKLAKKPNYERPVIFSENLIVVDMRKTTINLNKPIYLGVSVLDLSKTLCTTSTTTTLRRSMGIKLAYYSPIRTSVLRD